MNNKSSTAALQRLFGVGKATLTELAVRGIVHRAEKRGIYLFEAFAHLLAPHFWRSTGGPNNPVLMTFYDVAPKAQQLRRVVLTVSLLAIDRTQCSLIPRWQKASFPSRPM
jgi:hypothetical protein